jgi:hypothetical protein
MVDAHPLCLGCGHFRVLYDSSADLDGPAVAACDAYPEGIPNTERFSALLSETEHATALPGDHGVRFVRAPPKVYEEEE